MPFRNLAFRRPTWRLLKGFRVRYLWLELVIVLVLELGVRVEIRIKVKTRVRDAMVRNAWLQNVSNVYTYYTRWSESEPF